VGVLALAAAAAALVIALTLKQDAATNDDVNSLREQLSSVEASAAQQAQKNVRSLDQRLTDLEGKVSQLSTDQTTTKRELQVIQDDIRELRTQVSGGTGSGAGTGVGGTGAGLGGLGTGTGSGSAGTGSGGSGTGGNSGGVGP
jgi:TolA-binding protein